jgi:hypothetical protein
MQAVREVSGARTLPIPEPLAVGADYSLTRQDAPDAALRFGTFIMSAEGQKVSSGTGSRRSGHAR